MEEQKEPVEEAAVSDDATKTSKPPRWRFKLKGLIGRASLVSILVASVVVHGGGLWYYLVVRAGAKATSLETTLGEFRYAAADPQVAIVTKADFRLHVSLLPEVRSAARSLLATRQFKVQQDIEQLMRQASGGDFEEATLSELKRQLREQINTSLGIKAVDEVIITDLALELAEPDVEQAIDIPYVGSTEATSDDAR